MLVVDDDAALRALVRATLEHADVEVVEAGSVAEARAECARAKPDVVVLDIVMPVESGLLNELTARFVRCRRWCSMLLAEPVEFGVVLECERLCR